MHASQHIIQACSSPKLQLTFCFVAPSLRHELPMACIHQAVAQPNVASQDKLLQHERLFTQNRGLTAPGSPQHMQLAPCCKAYTNQQHSTAAYISRGSPAGRASPCGVTTHAYLTQHVALANAGQCSLYGVCLGALLQTANVAPSISLVTSAAAPPTTSIKQGYTYRACAPGQQPRPEAQCEPGATAQDSQDGSLTSQVLVCAPAACTTAACIASESSLHAPALSLQDPGSACCHVPAAIQTQEMKHIIR